MLRTVCAAILLTAAAGTAQATEAASNPLVKALFGADAGKAGASACFTRVYTPAHLVSHPQQNVRDLVILMSAVKDVDAGSTYSTRIGVHFRKLGSAFETGGSCGLDDNGKSIHCGADCDGGSMDVALKTAQTIYLKIPDGAAVWRPGTDAENPVNARFGSDDKIFKLTRAANARQCMSVLGKQ